MASGLLQSDRGGSFLFYYCGLERKRYRRELDNRSENWITGERTGTDFLSLTHGCMEERLLG